MIPPHRLCFWINHATHFEHVGFALYATCETLSLHTLIYPVSVWLALWGAVVFFKDDLPAYLERRIVDA